MGNIIQGPCTIILEVGEVIGRKSGKSWNFVKKKNILTGTTILDEQTHVVVLKRLGTIEVGVKVIGRTCTLLCPNIPNL